jgi:hypothetical protein
MPSALKQAKQIAGIMRKANSESAKWQPESKGGWVYLITVNSHRLRMLGRVPVSQGSKYNVWVESANEVDAIELATRHLTTSHDLYEHSFDSSAVELTDILPTGKTHVIKDEGYIW